MISNGKEGNAVFSWTARDSSDCTDNHVNHNADSISVQFFLPKTHETVRYVNMNSFATPQSVS